MITNNNSLRTELNDNNVLMINNNTNINNKIKTLQAKNAASKMEL